MNSANAYGISFTSGTLTGNAALSHAAAPVRVTGVLGGAFSLTKSGAGVLSLNGNNTFSGGVIQTTGTINLGHVSGLGSGLYKITGTSTLTPTVDLSAGVANAVTLEAGLTLTGTESLTLSGTITNSNATQTLTNNLDPADTFTIAGLVNLSESNTIRNFILSGTGNTVQSATSVIQNGGTGASILEKSGTGTLTLNGDNTYTGETILRSGTLILGHRDALGGTAARLQTATTTDSVVQANTNLTGANALPNAFLLNVANTIVSGTNSIQFNGTTTNNGGNRTLTNNMTGGATLTLGTVNLSEGNTARTLTFSGTGTTFVGVIANGGTGAGNLIKSGVGVLATTGTATFTGATTVNDGVLQIGNAGTTGNLNTTTGINLVATTSILRFNRSTALTSHTVAISGAGAVEQVGAGVTTLAATTANTYSGTTSISGGGLTIGNNGTAGTLGTGDVVMSNSTTLTFNRTDAQNIVNNITGTGNVTKTSTGAVTLTPATANTFAGNITVLNNSLIAGNASAFGTAGNNVFVTATGAAITATLNLNDNNYTSGSVTMGGTTATSAPVITTGTGILTLGGDLTYSATSNPLGAVISGNLDLGVATRSFNVADSTSATTDLDLQALVSGSGVGFTKTGSGTLSLGGGSANTFTGTTTVNGGTLILAKGAGLIVIGGNLAIGDGTGNDLVRLTNNDQIVSTSLVSFIGTGANAGILKLNGQSQALGGLNSTGGAGIVENGAVGLSSLTLNVASGTNDFSGIIQNGSAGTLALIKSGLGTQVLSGANTFTDGTTINDGALEVGSAGALGSSGTISFGGGALRFSSGNTTDYSARFSTAAAQPVKINTNGQSVTFATALTSSAGTLEKSGLGSLILSAANTYSGATAVNAGKLFVNGSLDVASAVTAAGGATLGGTGSIPGTVTVNNSGIIEAGHLGAGTLTIGTLSLGTAPTDTSIINLSNIATGTPGILDLTTLNVITDPSTITINISNAIAVATGTYKLIDYTGTALTAPQFSAFTLGTTTGFNSRQVLSLSNNTLLTQIELTMTGDAPKWTGALSSEWSTATLASPKNWVLISNGTTETDFLSGDQVLFDDTATGYVVNISNGDVDPASVVFNNSNGVGKTYTLQGSNGITGSTGLTKNNTGTLIINNANSFTGGVVINNGVVRLGIAGALGTGNLLAFGAAAPSGTKLQLNGNNATVTGLESAGADAVVENGTSASTNATLTVNQASGSKTFAGVLQNGGTDTLGLSQTGAGTLILTGTNTYTGGTSVGAGSTLQVGAGGAGGSIVGNATVNGTLSFNRTGTVAYGGTVSGTGSLSIVAGTLEFTGTVNNTLAGTSISSGATLQIGNGTAGGTVSSNIANAGTLVVNLPAAGNTLLSGNITGAGALTTTGGNGTTILTGANTYNGATTIGTGTILQVGNGGTAGALGTGTVTVDGTLRFSRTDALTVSAPLGGAGGVNIAGGSITYTGTNTYAGVTTVDSGTTLSIGQGGVLGSVAGDIVTNGSVIFNRGDAITYAGVISGAGTITKSGNGVTTFTGTNTYAGSTTINGGTLSISSGNNIGDNSATNTLILANGGSLQSTAASLTLGVNRSITLGTGGGALDVTGANTLDVNGVISGTSLTKTGTGVLTLSGANTHSAGTTLSAGTLNITQAAAIGSGLFTIAGGTIDVTGGSAITLANNLQAWSGDFTFTGTKDLNLGTGAVALSSNRAVTVSGGTLTVGGIIDDGVGNFTFTKNGAGTLYLAGVNTFGSNSAVTISGGGVLKIDAESGLGTNTNDVTFGTGGGTLQVTSGFTANTGKVFSVQAGPGTIQVDSGTLVIGSAIVGTGAATANGGGLIKTGAGTLALTVSSGAYDAQGVAAAGSGATGVGFRVDQGTLLLQGTSTSVVGDITPNSMAMQLNGGNLTIQTDTASIARANLWVSSDATLTTDRATAGGSLTQAIGTGTGAQLTIGNTSGSGGITLNVAGGANYTSGVATVSFGATTLNRSATFNITDSTGGGTTLLSLGAVTGGTNSIALTGSGDFAQTGAFASTAATSLTLNSGYSGLATLSQTNTYTGSTTINGGTLAFSTSANLGDATQATNSISINGGTLSYTGAGSLDIGANRVVTVGSSGATLNATGAAGILTVSGGISNTSTGNLTKTGLGSVIVSGTTSLNSGTGFVTVNGGLLAAGFGAGGVDHISVAAGAGLYNADFSATTLLLPSTGSLTLTAGTTLGAASKLGFGMNLTSAAAISLDATTPLTINSTSPGDTIYIDLVSLGTALTEQDYNLIIDTAPVGRLLTGTGGAVTYALDNVIGGYVYTLNSTANLVKVTVGSFSGNLYWHGDLAGPAGSWTDYRSGDSNWRNALTSGADLGVTPGSQTTVVFSATEATGPAISTTLDGNVTIKNLQFTSNPSGVTSVLIATGTFGSLTIGNALGIDVAANAGAISISAPVVLGASQAWAVDGTGANGSSLTVSGGVSGTAGLTISSANAGIVTLSGANLATYVGTTTVSSGILQAGAATSFNATSAHTIASGATLRLNGFNNTIGSLAGAGTVHNNTATNATLTTGGDNTSTTFSGTLVNGSTGTLGLTKVGAGTLTLSGTSNALTGNVTVSGGVLATTGTFNNGVGTTSVGSAASIRGVLYLGSGGSYSTTTIASGGNASGLGVLVIRGGAFATTTATTTAGVNSGNGGYGGVFMSSGSFSTRRFDSGTSVVSTAISVNQISGGTWSNSEFILLRNARAEFTITGGTVNHSGASAVIAVGELGTAATLTVAGGTLDNTGQTVQFGRVASSVSFGSVNLNAGTLITNGITGTAANITGGAARVNFNGGTLKASVASTTFLNTGLTAAYVNGAFGTFSGGAVVDTNGFNITFAEELLAPTGSGVTSLSLGPPGSGYIGAPYVEITGGGGTGATGYATVDLDPASGTFGQVTSVVLTNPGVGYTSTPTVTLLGGGGTGASATAAGIAANTSGSLTKIGTGTLTLGGTAANTYTGTTVINAGQLDLAKTAGVNAIAGNITIGDASGSDVLKLQASDQIADTSVVTLNGTVTNELGVFRLNGYSETIGGLAGNGVVEHNDTDTGVGSSSSTITLDVASGSQTYDGVIRNTGSSSTGTLALTKTGGGTQVLSGTNTYTGKTTINAGKLAISSETNLGGNPGTSTSDQLTLNGGTLQTAASFAIDDSNRGITVGASGGTIETNSGTTLTAANAVTINGALSKTGDGTLALNATNTGSGAINVSAGTLQVGTAGTGSTSVGSAVTVNGSGAALSGTGTVNGAITVTNGQIAPGDNGGADIGTLNSADVTLAGSVSPATRLTLQVGATSASSINDAAGIQSAQAGGTLSTYLSGKAIDYELEAGSHDKLNLTGVLSLNSGGRIALDNTLSYSFAYGDVFDLLDWGSISLDADGAGGFAAFDPNTDLLFPTLSGLAFNTDLFASNGIVVVVPESSRAIFLMFGLLGLMLRRRRR